MKFTFSISQFCLCVFKMLTDRGTMTSTPLLHGAVDKQSLEMVHILSDNGCEIDALDFNSRTALMKCAMSSEEIMVDYSYDNDDDDPSESMVLSTRTLQNKHNNLSSVYVSRVRLKFYVFNFKFSKFRDMIKIATGGHR